MTEATFGERLGAALRAKGWRQSDLVRESGLNKNTVSALVNSEQRPNIGTVGRIEAALGLTPGTLGATGEEPAEAPAFTGLEAVSDMALLAELGRRLARTETTKTTPTAAPPPPTRLTPRQARVVAEGMPIESAAWDGGVSDPSATV